MTVTQLDCRSYFNHLSVGIMIGTFAALTGCSQAQKRSSSTSNVSAADSEDAKAEEIEAKAKKAAKNYKVSVSSARKYFQLVAETEEAQSGQASSTIKLASKSGSSVLGVVSITDRAKGGVVVNYLIGGLTGGQDHGFHIHEKGNCDSEDGSSAGAHYNPEKKEHGDKATENHHAGDMGNITANSSGVAVVPKLNALVLKGIALEDLDKTAIIVHEKVDDLSTADTGNAGARWACGVIKVTPSEEE
jgi:Cu-Zn family superoxide dismutase